MGKHIKIFEEFFGLGKSKEAPKQEAPKQAEDPASEVSKRFQLQSFGEVGSSEEDLNKMAQFKGKGASAYSKDTNTLYLLSKDKSHLEKIVGYLSAKRIESQKETDLKGMRLYTIKLK